MKPIDVFFHEQPEPTRSVLLALRKIILNHPAGFTEDWKYGLPFYLLQNKMNCYLWIHKKLQLPYIGFVHGNKMEHPMLLQEARKKMKILLIVTNKNIPIRVVNSLLRTSASLTNSPFYS
jgi:hypothetical protein